MPVSIRWIQNSSLARENQTPSWFLACLSEALCLVLDSLVTLCSWYLPTTNWSRTDSSSRFDCVEQRKPSRNADQISCCSWGLIHLREFAFSSFQQAGGRSGMRWMDEHFLWWLLSHPELHSWLLVSFLWLFVYLRKKHERCNLTWQWEPMIVPSPLSSCCLKMRWT